MNNPVFTLEGSSRCVRWIEDTSVFRCVGFADEIAVSVKHKGWYTEDDGSNDEVLRGAVWQLPARNGVERYLAGYVDPYNDNAALIDVEIVGEVNEAARDADSLAEWCAESARDYNRAWQTSRAIEDKREEINHARADHSALIGELSKLTLPSQSLARDTVQRAAGRLCVDVAVLVAEIRELFETLPDGLVEA